MDGADAIGVAVLGLGARGRERWQALSKLPGVKLVAACDPDESALAGLDPAPAATHSQPRPALDNPAVQAVIVATPTHWTAAAAAMALSKGKDVFVEAPVCWSFAEGELLLAAARRGDRIVAVGHERRSEGAVRNAVAQARAGIVGPLYTTRAVDYGRQSPLPAKPDAAPPAGLHWDTWQGPVPPRPYNPNYTPRHWRRWWDYGHGELGAQAIDALDTARWMLGAGLPSQIFCSGGRWGADVAGDTPNAQHAVFTFPDGRILDVEIRGLPSHDEVGTRRGVLAFGAQGWLAEGDGFQPHIGYKEDGKPPTLGNLPPVGGSGEGDALTNFVAAVKSRRAADVNCPLAEGVLTAQLCCLATISCRLGRALHFDPDPRRFIGDAEADAMLTRAKVADGFVFPQEG
jgi:predicted dehydrogenase